MEAPIVPFSFTPRLYTVHLAFEKETGLGLQVEEGSHCDKYVIGLTRDNDELKRISLMDRIVGMQGKDISSMSGHHFANMVLSMSPHTPLFVLTLESSFKQTISFTCSFCLRNNHCDDDVIIERLLSPIMIIQLSCFYCNRKCSLLYDENL